MDFSAFDRTKLDEYSRQAKENWGKTEAYREFAEKDGARTDTERNAAASGLMAIFKEFGAMRALKPEDGKVQAQVSKLRAYITDNYYNCTVPILSGLGAMYSAGGERTENIDRAGGEGSALFAARAIEIYCAKN